MSLKYEGSTDPKKRKYTGSLQYNDTILGVKDPKVSIYYQDGSFGFDGWEMFKEIADAKKFAEAIQKGSQADANKACGALVDFVIDEVVKTKFYFTIGMPTGQKKDNPGQKVGQLECVMHWKYNVSVLDFSADIDVIDVPITIRGPFSKDKVWEALGNFIEDNLANIGKALMDKPEKFAAFIAVLSLEKCGREAIARLICRKLNSKNLKTQAKQQNSKDSQKVQEQMNKVTTNAAAATAAAAGGGIAGAAAAVAEGGTTLLAGGPLLGVLTGGALASIIGSHGDDDDKKDLKEARDKAEASLQQAKDQLEAARKQLQQRLMPSGPPSVQITPSMSTSVNAQSIVLDWSKTAPQDTHKSENEPQVTYKIRVGTTDNVKDSHMVDFAPTTATTFTTPPNAEYVFEKTFFAFVRASITVKSETFEASDWSKVSITQQAKLRAPKAVKLSVAEGGSGPEWRVDVVDPVQGATYQVKITGVTAQSAEIVLHEANFQGAQTAFQFPTYSPENTPDISSVIATVSRVAEGPDKDCVPSSTVTSGEPIKVVAVRGLHATVVGKEVVLNFGPLPAGVQFSKFLFSKSPSDKSARDPVKKDPDAVYFDINDIEDGKSISVEIRLSSTNANEFCLITAITFKVQGYWTMKITDISSVWPFQLAEPWEIRLRYELVDPKSVTNIPKPATLLVRTDGSDEKKVEEAKIDWDSNLLVGNIRKPWPHTVQMAAVGPSGERGQWSDEWSLPPIPDPPYTVAPFVTFSKGGKVTLEWEKVTPADDRWKGVNGRVYSNWTDGTHSTQWEESLFPKTSVEVTVPRPEDLTVLNAKAALWLPNLRLSGAADQTPSAVDLCMPVPFTWDTYTSPNSTQPGPNSSLASVSLKQDHLEVWWTSADGAIQSTWFDHQWRSQQFLPPASALSGGSSITAFSRRPLHQEVLWIGPNGAVTGRWYNDDHWQTGTDYAFDKEGTAATTKGGSLVALARDTYNMDLYWVAPDLSIRTAHWTEKIGWRGSSTIVGANSVSQTDLSELSAAPCEGDSVMLCWIGGDGSVQSAFCQETSVSFGPPEQKTIAGADTPFRSGGSSIHVRAVPKPVGCRVFWTTTQGRLATSWFSPAKGSWSSPVFMTVSGAVSLASKITSNARPTQRAKGMYGAEDTTAHRVFFFNQQSKLCSIEGRWVNNETDLGWLNLGAEEGLQARSTGSMSLTAASWNVNHVETWWVADDGVVHGRVGRV